MTTDITTNGDTPGHRARRTRTVKVWDLPTRVFHWSLVGAVGAGLVTGYIAPEWWMGLHIWAGYTTVGLLVFRLVWGVFGSEYARLESFTYGPVHILSHLKEIITLRPTRHYIGHNPSGAVMIFALLIVLSAISVSGLIVLGGEENQGPLAGAASYAMSEIAGPAHELLVGLLLAMIALHVAGVVLETRLGGQNLVRAMFNGKKTVPAGTPALVHRRARPLAAVAAMGVFAALAGSLLTVFAAMEPSGIVALPANETYESECGDCHNAFHPSLLPVESWSLMMAGLDDHFGEDASLGEETQKEITAYLLAYGAEKWDTEASNRFRVINPETPLRITATPYWVRKHHEIKPEVFKQKNIASKSNCAACHKDYYSGRFDDQNISIPTADK